MISQKGSRRMLLITIFLYLYIIASIHGKVQQTPDHFLALGDNALAQGDNEQAIMYYEHGIKLLQGDESLSDEISLHTNLATALSAEGKDKEAAESYQNALLAYKTSIDDIVSKGMKEEATLIAAQAAFFLGMVNQDLGNPIDAAEAYSYACALDPQHWASAANLGALYHDELADYRRAIEAYNQAYSILTNSEMEPTDPPPEPRFVLSQLQYRIGLCINHDANRKCALVDDPANEVDCNELARQAFADAVHYDPENVAAKHMLATVTADATMERASNAYVKSLFDDYAGNFEHSLVRELGYNGFERLRRGFDRAFDGKPPVFTKVIDAGCGTGLVGEQFRNVSRTLIGVDLSEAILDEAVKKRPTLYDETIAGDVTDIFIAQKPLSLIVAGDSYIYFGDLDPLFESMHQGLDEGGYVAFTLENVDKENEALLTQSKPDWRWQLMESGRFAHRKEYVVSVGVSHNMELLYYEPLDGFRFERGAAVRGHLFVMRKNLRDHYEL